MLFDIPNKTLFDCKCIFDKQRYFFRSVIEGHILPLKF